MPSLRPLKPAVSSDLRHRRTRIDLDTAGVGEEFHGHAVWSHRCHIKTLFVVYNRRCSGRSPTLCLQSELKGKIAVTTSPIKFPSHSNSLLNPADSGLVLGASGSGRVIRQRMKLQEGGCGVTGTSRNFAEVRSLGDPEQQADQQIAPQQPGELLGKFGRTACE